MTWGWVSDGRIFIFLRELSRFHLMFSIAMNPFFEYTLMNFIYLKMQDFQQLGNTM